MTELPTNTSTPKPKSFLNKWNNSTENVLINDLKNLKMYDVETQTDSVPILLKKSEQIIKQLAEENLSLKKQLQKYKDKDSTTDSFSERYSESSKEDPSESLRKSNRRSKFSFNSTQSVSTYLYIMSQ